MFNSFVSAVIAQCFVFEERPLTNLVCVPYSNPPLNDCVYKGRLFDRERFHSALQSDNLTNCLDFYFELDVFL